MAIDDFLKNFESTKSKLRPYESPTEFQEENDEVTKAIDGWDQRGFKKVQQKEAAARQQTIENLKTQLLALQNKPNKTQDEIYRIGDILTTIESFNK